MWAAAAAIDYGCAPGGGHGRKKEVCFKTFHSKEQIEDGQASAEGEEGAGAQAAGEAEERGGAKDRHSGHQSSAARGGTSPGITLGGIAIVRNNLRDLMEQATGTSGSATEELLSDRVASAEAELQRLNRERDVLAKGKGR